MRWLRIAVLCALGLVLLALALFSAQPHSYRIARTRTIAAPSAHVMAQLSDLRAFEAWDPWPAEPGMRPLVTYSPVASGVGAWVDRRDRSGGARTTITSLTSDQIELSNVTSGAFGSGASTQTFALSESGSSTTVTWTLSSDLHGLGRLLWPFVNLEARVGPEMDAALSRLDRAATR